MVCCGMWQCQQSNIHHGGHTLRGLYFQLNECICPNDAPSLFFFFHLPFDEEEAAESLVVDARRGWYFVFGAHDWEKTELVLNSVVAREDCLDGWAVSWLCSALLFKLMYNWHMVSSERLCPRLCQCCPLCSAPKDSLLLEAQCRLKTAD